MPKLRSSPKPRSKVPAYRQRKGYPHALVTLTDSKTGHRRDYWLGEFGTPESRELYHRTIAEWESRGRRLPPRYHEHSAQEAANEVRVCELIRDYWGWAESYYRPKHLQSLEGAISLLKSMYGESLAAEFGPKKLRLLRDEMIRGDQSADPPRKPWARRYINSQIQRIRHMFKWASARELVPVTVHQSLCTLEPLKRGRCNARETEKVGPVPQELLDATRKRMNRQVKALVDLQLLTGARPGELLQMRWCDIENEKRDRIWIYRPVEHKNAFRGQERVLYFGPRAKAIIRQFLKGRSRTAYIFSPKEAEAERQAKRHQARMTPDSCGNRPGTNRLVNPEVKPGGHYTTNTYARAIRYACEAAFPLPEHLRRAPKEKNADYRKRLAEGGLLEQLSAWRRRFIWHPHQLRHNAATNLRRQFGLEAAQLTLGHASATITDAVYAERDQRKVMELMRKAG